MVYAYGYCGLYTAGSWRTGIGLEIGASGLPQYDHLHCCGGGVYVGIESFFHRSILGNSTKSQSFRLHPIGVGSGFTGGVYTGFPGVHTVSDSRSQVLIS